MKDIHIDDVLKDISVDDIKGRISELKGLDLYSQNFDELKDLVYPLVQCGFSTVTFPKGMKIHRGRCINVNKEYIKRSCQISYPPPPDKNVFRYNRASTGKYQIFYGSASKVYGDQELGHIAVNFELSQIHKNWFSDPYEYIALGRWYSSNDFKVAVVGLDSSIAENNNDAVKLREFQTNIVNDLPERFEVIRLVSEFLSGEFSKIVEHDFEYKITAAYGEILFDLGFPAIMYPSVKTEGNVFNIAIIKSIVNEYLSCEVAAITRFRKIKGKVFSDYYLVSETVNADGTFNWHDPPASAVISNAELKRIEREIDEKGKFTDHN